MIYDDKVTHDTRIYVYSISSFGIKKDGKFGKS